MNSHRKAHEYEANFDCSLDFYSEQECCTRSKIQSIVERRAQKLRKLIEIRSNPIVQYFIKHDNSTPLMEEKSISFDNSSNYREKSKISSLIIPPANRNTSIKKKICKSSIRDISFQILSIILLVHLNIITNQSVHAQGYDSGSTPSSPSNNGALPSTSESVPQGTTTAATCFGGLQTFEKISMSSFENPSSASSSSNSFGSGILVQQDDQALTSECVNLCRSQSNCLSFVIDYNKFECKSYATTQQELQQEFDAKYQSARSINNATSNGTDYQAAAASTLNFQHLLPSTSSNYFEKICLDGVANRNQFSDVCGQGRLWTIERVVDTFLDGYVEKEVTNVNNKDECSKLCIFETQFVCRSADYDHHSRLCRLSKEDRRTQPQAIRYVPGSNRQYLENQCATPGPSSCVYETKKNVGIISMDALKFAQTVQDCQMKCNQETTFNCRSYSFHQQRCFLSGDDSSSLNSNLIKLPSKQGWSFGEKKCLVELCTKGVFSYEKITGFTLRSALSTPIDLMMLGSSAMSIAMTGNNLEDLERLQHESSQPKLRQLLPMFHQSNGTSNMVSTMMMMAANSNPLITMDPMHESASTRAHRSANNLAITDHCRHSCDLGYLNCPAFAIDYKNNRCQRLDRNSQGRHHELVARDGFAYYEKICLRVPEIMSMCQDKYWIFERVIGYELAPRLYEKSLKFVQSRRDCEEYCLEEKQFQCRSALYNDETSDCKLSKFDRRIASREGGYYRNFNVRISYLENQCIRDHGIEKKQCRYEQAKEEPAYPTFTEHIEMVPNPKSGVEMENSNPSIANNSMMQRTGSAFCEQLCNDNTRFECHSFGYYSSTAQCFLSGDDTISAGESATTPSTGFVYFEKKCRLGQADNAYNYSMPDGGRGGLQPTSPATTVKPQNYNPYFQTDSGSNTGSQTSTMGPLDIPSISNNNNISIHIDQQVNYDRPKPKPTTETTTELSSSSSVDPNQYKCGHGHSFVYQRISGFEPIGGYLTLLVKNNDHPGIVSECSELCKRAYECRAFVVDYNSNQCYAMLENSSVGMLSLRQSLGKDYFEGFCVANHILLTGSSCRNKTWVIDKIVDQAVVGVQHQKLIPDSDRVQCRQACLEERFFWCKSAMFDSSSGECKLYTIDRESVPQMRLLFTKGVDFFENQCQIMSNACPYDAIERDMTIITTTKAVQAKSTFDCETACNSEINFNCRSYTYLDQYPSLPNLCLLSADSRSTSQRGSVKEHPRTLYAERNCFYRRPRFPGGGGSGQRNPYVPVEPIPPPEPEIPLDPYQMHGPDRANSGYSSMDKQISPPRTPEIESPGIPPSDVALGQGCEPHQYTFERTFGFDFRLGQKERAPIAPTIGIAIACQQECLRRGDRCQSFVVEYALPYQSCFLIATQVGSNKKLLVKSPNSAYFEKVCLPRTGVDPEALTTSHLQSNNNPLDLQSMDIAPSYSSEPWTPQVPSQLPNYLQQQQLAQSYPSRSCAKLWSYERFVNHNFTAPSDRMIENTLNRAHCEAQCLNEASFSCRSVTYDYNKKLCRLFKNTRRTILSQFIDLEAPTAGLNATQTSNGPLINSHPGTAHVLSGSETELIQTSASGNVNTLSEANKRQGGARQLAALPTAEPSNSDMNIDYMENTCVPEPSSCQYRQIYDQFSPYIDKMNHAVSLSDCQRQCDLERLFSCKSVNYDPITKNCMLLNEDLISLNRGQQGSLLPKKNTIYSEKGNCEMISVQCNSQEMLVSINFDSPFRGRVMAKGNPEQCFLIGDGQTSLQFPIVFGPKCNSRQEGHNTFVNEIVIQQHPVIMTDNDKTVRVMCAFEAPDQTITLKNPTSRDNKTGIDVGSPDASRTRHDKQQFNSVVSNKASPPSVLLRILDPSGRDASMISLGDDLMLRIQMQMDGGNSALGIFARNLAARSSNGESLLLIDNEGCPVDPQVFPALEVDAKDGKSLQSTFKAFRFPSSGLVNFEVQIKFCPERCQPTDCHRGKMKSFGRKKRDLPDDSYESSSRTSIIQSVTNNRRDSNPLDALSTVMKPGKAFQYVRELMLAPESKPSAVQVQDSPSDRTVEEGSPPETVSMEPEQPSSEDKNSEGQPVNINAPSEEFENNQPSRLDSEPSSVQDGVQVYDQSTGQVDIKIDSPEDAPNSGPILQSAPQKSILMHIDEKVMPVKNYVPTRGLNHSPAPYGRFPDSDQQLHHRRHTAVPQQINPISADVIDVSTESAVRTEPSSVESIDSTNGLLNDPQNTYTSTEQPTMVSTEGANYPGAKISSFNQKDLPLRFSILVGDNQAPTADWVPTSAPPVLIMNSTNIDPDNIVVAGQTNQQGQRNNADTEFSGENTSKHPNDVNKKAGLDIGESINRGVSDQNIDTSASNSVAAEVKINNCQVESGRNRLKTIIWTGSFVIGLNICLVILSLALYFKKVHLRKHHTMTRASSDCGAGGSNSCLRWPSVLLKSKSNLGTSLNTHEHFFCKLNSKPSGPSTGVDRNDYNWPNFSASTSRSTVSSLSGATGPMSNMRPHQNRGHHILPFDAHSSLRSNFTTGHKSILDIAGYDGHSNNIHATYTNNIDETRTESFQQYNLKD